MKSSSRKKRLFFCLVKVTFKEKEKWANFSWYEVSFKKQEIGNGCILFIGKDMKFPLRKKKKWVY